MAKKSSTLRYTTDKNRAKTIEQQRLMEEVDQAAAKLSQAEVEGPTRFLPGSPGKIIVLRARAMRNLPLWVPGDGGFQGR